MKSTMKAGSVLRVPGVSTWSYTRTDPSVLQVAWISGELVVTAIRPGSATVTLAPSQDVRFQVDVSVTPA